MAIDAFNQEGTGLANGADNADEMKQGVDQGIDTGRQAYDIYFQSGCHKEAYS